MSKIFRKTLVAVVVIFGIIANATALLSAWILYHNLTDEYVSKGRSIALSIAASSVEVLLNRDASTVQAMIDEFLQIEGVGYVFVADKTGRIISHTFVPHVPRALPVTGESYSRVLTEDVSIPNLGDFIQVSAPILAGEAGVVGVGMNKDIIWTKMRSAVIRQEILMLLMLAVAVIVFYILAKGISRPLVALADYAVKIKNHDFSAELDIDSKDEVGVLAATMRSMSGELSLLVSDLERAVADTTRELQDTLAHLKAIIDNLADGLVVVDAAGRVSHFNPALCAMFGLPGLDLTGKEAKQLFSGTMAELADRARTAGAAMLSAEVRLSGGRTGKALATSIRSEGEAGRAEAPAVVLVRDITSEKAVDRMKTEFISTVSHELRTPLTSVLGFAKIIRKKFADDIVPTLPVVDIKPQRAVRQIQENLGIIVAEGERLTDLVDDVLDIAKMEAGKVEWDMRPVRLAEVVARSLQASRAAAEQKGLTLVNRVPGDLPPILGDRDRLIQVMLNLISNAVKFTARGAITVTAEATGEGVRVGVADTGAGIAAADQDAVFEKFKQAGDTLTEKPKGTGLGLPICRQIVGRHGGRIWVESERGAGSTFFFTLPLTPKGEAAEDVRVTERAKPEPRPDKGQKAPETVSILAVDDDPGVRHYLKALFSDEGYGVLTAADGAEALRLAAQAAPDLITMDLKMPGLDGASAVRALRANPATREIPVVVISALSAVERNRAGADAVMNKPVDETALLETIKGLLHGAGHTTRPCLAVTGNGATVGGRLFLICPGEVEHATEADLWPRLEAGFVGTVLVPASVSQEVDLTRLSAFPGVSLVILPD